MPMRRFGSQFNKIMWSRSDRYYSPFNCRFVCIKKLYLYRALHS